MHAAVQLVQDQPELGRAWRDGSGTVVSLSCDDELALWDWVDRFPSCSVFYEPDVSAYTSMAVFLSPDEAKKLSKLPLLLGEGVMK